jgi:RNA polymerase sigma-70 factor, ECF subfamily
MSTLTTTPATDDEFLSRLRARDERACEQLVRDHGPKMLAVARRFMRCDHDAHDALQDAFLSAFNAVGAFTGQSSLATWLHRITVNACLMRLRSQSRHETASLDDLLPAFDQTGHRTGTGARGERDVVDHVAAIETRAHVRACIGRLPETYRTVLLLRDIEGLDTAQAASAMGCSEANVKTRLHRARQALKTLIETPDAA